MATTRSKIVAELIGTAGTIDNAKLTGSITNAKLAGSISADKLAPGAGGTDWAHTDRIQSSNFDAVSNKGYYVNTSSAAVTVTLPSTPSDGDVISLVDVTGSANSNIILINPNGKKINGNDYDFEIASIRSGVQLTYSGSTYGWIATESVNDYNSVIIVVGRPIVSSFVNSAGEQYFQADGNSLTITGRNFKADATVKFIDTDGTEYTSSSVGVGSIPLTLTATIPTGMTAAVNATDDKDPFDIKVTNAGDNKFGILENLLEWLPAPTFSPAINTNLGTIYRTANINTLSDYDFPATSLDADDTVTIATTPQTGTLPTGISLSNTGTLSGTVGSPASGNTTHTFTLRATADSGVESITADSPTYTLVTKGTRVTGVDITTFDGSSGTTFTVTGHGFVDNSTITQADQGVKLVSGGFTQYVNNINVVSDTQLTFTTSANILATDITGTGLDIVVKLVGSTDEFKLSDDSNSTRINAPAGITAGGATALTSIGTSRGSYSHVITSATDVNGGSIASYTLGTVTQTISGTTTNLSAFTFSLSGQTLTASVPTNYEPNGGTIDIPITITDNVGNTLIKTYTITVASQGFSYPLGISHSAMFDGSSYLRRNMNGFSTTTYTLSMWIKRTKLGNIKIMGKNDNPYVYHEFSSSDKYIIVDSGSGMGSSVDYESNNVLRDTYAWYHFVTVYNISSSLDVKFYINGSLASTSSLTGVYGNGSRLGGNYDTYIGRERAGGVSGTNFEGYMANIDFIDGQALSADYFGKTQDGIWVAKAFNGQDNTSGGGSATNNYGTNGFKLAFADSSDLGKDTAPLTGAHSTANNWTNV